jgi:sensor domain CHASE-containing protein
LILKAKKKKSNTEYHTYQLREDKPTCVVIHHINPSTSTDLIKTELKARLLEVRLVINVLHKATKSPLPLFFVDLEPTAYSNGIYQLSSFLHTKIKVENPKSPTNPK